MLEVSMIMRRRVRIYRFIFLNLSEWMSVNFLLDVSNFVAFLALFPRS